MSPSPVLSLGCTPAGMVARLEGRGTMHESPAFQAFVRETLSLNPHAILTVSLTGCDYLDSTFLGCLIGLTKSFSCGAAPPRFFVAADQGKRKQLFGATGLERVFKTLDAEPVCEAKFVPLPSTEVESRAFAVHAMECHRRLGENTSGTDSDVFHRIADRLESELNAKG